MIRLWPLLLLVLVANPQSVRVAQDASPATIVLRECLVLDTVSSGTRSLVFTDPIEHAFVMGTLVPPKAGASVTAADGRVASWAAAEAVDGALRHASLRGGYCWWTVSVPAPEVRLLHAQGHVSVYVNDEPRIGDVYNSGIVQLSVQLRAGANHFLFRCARGNISARLEPLAADTSLRISDADMTLPDFVSGQHGEYWAAAVVQNFTPHEYFVRIEAGIEGVVPKYDTIGPLSVRKVKFQLPYRGQQGTRLRLPVRLEAYRRTASADEPPVLLVPDRKQIAVDVKAQHENRKVTFISNIDGSVQYYSVNPARPLSPDQPLGIVLSCHGASVEASGQAAAYGSKTWCHIVCPTNRRPYGFDWEDWGRIDALEVLAHAKATLPHDPSMVYLTGHSMGGHGAWQLGAHFPDKFAAVGPSAGWQSFWTYGGKRDVGDDAFARMLRRSDNPSDTLLLKHNYAQQAVYILHGDADDNVPVREARAMHAALKEFHPDLHMHEEPGAGHWWDRGDVQGDTGADCVDWQPMFELFAKRRLRQAAQVRELDFTTISPGISADCHWVTIAQQQKSFEPSRVQLRADPNIRRIVGTTGNVGMMALRVGSVMQPGELKIELDGGQLTAPWPADGVIWLRRGESWQPGQPPAVLEKNPARYGGFKSAFNNRVLIVYGTGGDAQARHWAFAKARLDAENFWYRGNGSIDVIADTTFDPAEFPDRNVILIGCAATNAAHAKLKLACPVQVNDGTVKVGESVLRGDLALLVVYPRPDSDFASVGVVAATSAAGMRLTNRLPYLAPGVGVPDYVVLDAAMLARDGAGRRAAGFFDPYWQLAGTEMVLAGD